jgi:hypothetical protein
MPHAKAVVAGRTIAETDDYEVVEGNIYVCVISCLTLKVQRLTVSVPTFVRADILSRRDFN